MSVLEVLRLGLLTIHFLGMAALVGTFLLQLRQSTVSGLRLMLAGAAIRAVSGNALIASNRLQGMEVIETKMVAKLVLATVGVAALFLAAVWT